MPILSTRFVLIFCFLLSSNEWTTELGFERLLTQPWTTNIKSLEDDRKYKWTTKKKGSEKSYELKATIKRNGTEKLPIVQTYTIKVSSGSSGNKSVEKKKKSEKVKDKGRVVEIKEQSDHGGLVLRQLKQCGCSYGHT